METMERTEEYWEARIKDDIEQERSAVELFESFVKDNKQALRLIAPWGDGRCGWMLSVLLRELLGEDRFFVVGRKTKPKAAISKALAKQVFERDAYRCRRCASWIDLCCDHVVPESAGGETTIDNLQTLCRPCNSKKGVGA